MMILAIGTSSWDNFLQLIGVSILFIFILIITYYTTRLVGGVKMGMTKTSNFKVLETFKVAQNKYLQLIQVGSRYFVIAICKDDIRFLAELNESDIKLPEVSKSQTGNFKEVFHLILKNQKGKNKDDQNSDQQ
jgi:flagellar protein FliO/FliZ